MTTTPKGWTTIQNSDALAGPAQINGAELFVEDLIGESVSTPADLPSSGNWVGRTIFVGNLGAHRVWDGSNWLTVGPGVQTIGASPSGTVNTPTSGSSSPWFNIGTVDVPAGTSTALVTLHVVGLQSPTTTCNVSIQALLGSQAGQQEFRIPGSSQGAAQSFSWVDTFTSPTAGTQYVALATTIKTGSGVFFLNTDSFLSARVEFR